MLSLLMLQHALVLSITDVHARPRLPANPDGNRPGEPDSQPYLKVTGVRPLRFDDAPPPPDLASKPPAGAPPLPPATKITSVEPALATPTLALVEQPKPLARIAEPVATTPAAKPADSTLSILQDDSRPSTRPEDFLPFFQFPGGGGGMTAGAPPSPSRPPAPGQLPPSSATYQQK